MFRLYFPAQKQPHLSVTQDWLATSHDLTEKQDMEWSHETDYCCCCEEQQSNKSQHWSVDDATIPTCCQLERDLKDEDMEGVPVPELSPGLDSGFSDEDEEEELMEDEHYFRSHRSPVKYSGLVSASISPPPEPVDITLPPPSSSNPFSPLSSAHVAPSGRVSKSRSLRGPSSKLQTRLSRSPPHPYHLPSLLTTPLQRATATVAEAKVVANSQPEPWLTDEDVIFADCKSEHFFAPSHQPKSILGSRIPPPPPHRVVPNTRQLLMLAVEFEMMREGKIVAPLRQRGFVSVQGRRGEARRTSGLRWEV